MSEALEFDASLFGPLWYGAGLARQVSGDEWLVPPPRLLQYFPDLGEPDDPLGEWESAQDKARARGWIDRAGQAIPWVADTMRLLAYASAEADTRFASQHGQHVRGLVSISGEQAVRTRVEGREVRIDPVWPTSAYSALVGLWPEITPVRGSAVSIRLEDARSASKSAAAHQKDAQVNATIRELRVRKVRSDDARDYARMVSGERVHDGEFSVAVRDSRGKLRTPDSVVLLTGTTQGSYLQYLHGEFLVTAPADPGLVARTLSERAGKLSSDASAQ
ncbi:ESX secretion-associated protein EspG [Saccharopolyspora spinosa]|uniref:ESAT-6 protein secretion system EspG family protein n=1 Tax=Saccharopolyspora spinosa TaxID=60894 RepID=A0A2N3Y6H1_SACSN|nr:ESX secretion-associated protein EspG [Saccharopolyspora spinosa]PKW18478.1 ESAT-6 protein secretion system EspG family protein [Saccharopolyspora spinosa]